MKRGHPAETFCFPLPGDVASLYAGKRVMVTGGRGFVGAALSQALATLGCSLVLVDRSPADMWMPEGKAAAHVRGDVSEPGLWSEVLPRTDYVFHLASMEFARGERYDVMADVRSNFIPTLQMLERCRIEGYKPKIIFASSANLAGKQERLPVDETMRDNPPSLWSAHKLIAEHYLRVYAGEYGIPSVCLRLSNVYGPTPKASAMRVVAINKAVAMGQEKGRLLLYPNKDCRRDYVFIDDVVRAFLMAGAALPELSNGQFYYIGSGESQTIAEAWGQIADALARRLGQPVPVDLCDVPMTGHAMREFVANTQAFERVTGWRPMVLFRQGLELTLDALGIQPDHPRSDA